MAKGSKMRGIWLTVSVMLVGCAGRSGSLSPEMSRPLALVERESPPTLTVTGNGEVAVKPDLVIIRLGAEIQTDQASTAQQRVNEVTQRALAALKAAGVAGEDLQTSGLTVTPVYSDEARPAARKIVWYRATNVVEMRLADTAKAGTLIDAAMAAGVNRLEGISFELKNDHEQRREAMRKAAEDARQKASLLAAAMRVRITQLDSVDEVNTGYSSLFGGGGGSGGGDSSTPVEAGRVRILATVSAHYRFVPLD
jgi:uncharacterized protein YggE